MTEKKNMILNILPQKLSGWIILILIVVVAFSLGSIFSGKDVSPDGPDRHDHAEKTSAPTLWTCSMHPQIKLPEPGKCPICFMDLIPLESSGGDELDLSQIRISETARQMAKIQTARVVSSSIDKQIRLTGKIGYDERNVTNITAWIGGRLEKMYVNYTGSTVKKNEKMVEIYSPDLLVAKEEYLQAQKALEKINPNSTSILKSTAETTFQAAMEKLKLYGLSEQQIETIDTFQTNITINAPSQGIVIAKNATEGMYVKTGSSIYTIADLSSLWVIFDAYEPDLPWLKEKQKITFTAQSIPGYEFEGAISFIDPQVDAKKRTVKLRVDVDNKDGRLKPEMFVTGVVSVKMNNLTSKTSKEAPLLIPASAPLITGKRAIVYVEIPNDEGSMFEGREIVLGSRVGDFYIVETGLKEGEMVVTNGAFKLDSELQIQAKKSMMAPAGGLTQTGQHQHSQPAPVIKNEIQTEIITRDALNALTSVYDSYFKVQMALADDDLAETKKGYHELLTITDAVDMTLFKNNAHNLWMKFESEIKKHSQAGEKSDSFEAARATFLPLSETFIEMHNKFGHSDERNYYLTFCPMADNNQGAYWLQTVDTVYNSFYGDSMLRCGSIKETLKTVTKFGE